MAILLWLLTALLGLSGLAVVSPRSVVPALRTTAALAPLVAGLALACAL